MNSSYRVRTQVGVDKSVPIDLEQEFETLEILSLKIYQRDIYTRVCSDYGVICGRVFSNKGYGIPNVKLSLFVPLTDEDSQNPIISEIYPYTNIDNLDENGYRYNLLPKESSHGGHTPTGTFPTRLEVLTNKNLSEVYEKYYKYTVKTNESGDYMIFGVPVGSYTIVMDVDLSDIGEFSLTPQDLIRLGLATEGQVAGSRFNASSNLNSLPQIINLTKQVEVLPLWGEEEVCKPSITRTDFDLTQEANIDLTPTAVFIGSIMSTEDEIKIGNSCKVPKKIGEFCKLVTGPGQIKAIRQTINYDTDSASSTFGYPQLEEFKLENDGHVIDENGAWMVEVPMNLDYVYTNEFGVQTISSDPTVGVPTKGKYRFKIKWNQSPSLSEETRRGYFLVPNVKEWGWTGPSDNYFEDGNPAFYASNSLNSEFLQYQQSYSFSLDWLDYGNPLTPEGQQMLQEAINCEDRFFEFEYKKLYTISQLMDKYKNGNGQKFIGIKNILDGSCSSENNKYPINDAYRGTSILYLMFSYFLSITKMLIFPIIIVLHAVALILYVVNFILTILIWTLYAPIYYFVDTIVNIINGLVPGSPLENPFNTSPSELTQAVFEKITIRKLPIPLLLQSEGECTFCDCKENEAASEYENASINNILSEQGNSCNLPLNDGNQFSVTISELVADFSPQFRVTVGGIQSSSTNASVRTPSSAYLDPYSDGGINYNEESDFIFSNQLPFAERVNLSNLKDKYFANSNIIRTYIEPDLNGNQYHTDNTLTFIITGCEDTYQTGKLITFQDPSLSTDPNQTIALSANTSGGLEITGTSSSAQTITLTYASASNNVLNGTVTYNLPLKESSEYIDYMKYKSDIEYFQVLTAITYSDFIAMGGSSTGLSNQGTFHSRLFKSPMWIGKATNSNNGRYEMSYQGLVNLNTTSFSTLSSAKIVICTRGVDPYSPKFNTKYDISRILNQPIGTVEIQGDYRINIPISPGGTDLDDKKKSVRHFQIENNNDTDSNGGRTFFSSFFFTPGSEFQPYETEMPKYYGSLDEYLTNPQNPFRVIDSYTYTRIFSVGVNSGSLRVKMSSTMNGNAFTRHSLYTNDAWGFPAQPNDNTYVNGITEDGGNTWGGSSYMLHNGEYYGDSIEGGSYMYQNYSEYNNQKWTNSSNIYYSPAYTTTSGATSWGITYPFGVNGKIQMTNPSKIIFRSDRLPTSTTERRNANNSMLFFQNKNFSVYSFNDDTGEITAVEGFNGGADAIETEDNFFSDGSSLGGINDQVVASLSDCAAAVPFECYQIDENGTVLIEDFPNCTKDLGVSYFQNGKGCYTFVNVPVIGIPWDFFRISEWYNRTLFNLFLCLDGIEYDFYNNWVSGNLFMPTIYATNFPDLNGNMTRRYCKDVVVFHEATKNYYYRSSPYRYNYGFLGGRTRERNKIGSGNDVRGNNRNLKTPTTIINLGPITDYASELVQGVGYSGYIANYLTPTSYRDITDIVNFYVLSRNLELSYQMAISIYQTIANFATGTAVIQAFTNSPINHLFGDRNSNESSKVNADLAQLVSINSEFGVHPFSPSSYPTSGNLRIIILYDGLDVTVTGGAVIPTPQMKFITGIFFEAYDRKRDAITPKRLLWNQNAQLPFQPNDITNYSQPTQVVPLYQWELDFQDQANLMGGFLNIPVPDPNTPVIFGSAKNDWKTTPINSNDTFFSYGFQNLDRTNNTSRYFMANTNQQKYLNGFIYNIDSNGNFEILKGNITNTVNTVGAPYHFYFGLKKGRTAMDLFYIKYVDTDIVIE
jgi:hypothetical protein